MAAEFAAVFAALKAVFGTSSRRLSVASDTATAFTLKARSSSPFPQHKGRPLEFGSVRVGKSYVSLHLMPLYMNAALVAGVSPALKKRMQGKTCFNFKHVPDAALLAELQTLAEAGLDDWAGRGWL